MSEQSEATDNELRGCLLTIAVFGGGYLLLRLVIAIHEATWPIWLLLLVSGTGWYLTTRHSGPWSRANASVLMPVTLGLGTLFVTLLALNLGRFLVTQDTLRSWEEHLITLRLRLSDWLDLPLPVFLTGLVLLILLSFLAPRLKLVSLSLSVEKAAYTTYIALVTITSFTFFSQLPLQDMVDEEHERNRQTFEEGIERYDLLFREEKSKIGEYLAARAIRASLEGLDDQTAASYQEMFRAIDPASSSELDRAAETFANLKLAEEEARAEEASDSFGSEREKLRRLAARNRRPRASPAAPDTDSTARWLPEIRAEVAASLGRAHAASVIASDSWAESRWNLDVPEVSRRTVPWASETVQKPPTSPKGRRAQIDLLAEQARLLDEQARRAESVQQVAAQAREGLAAVFCRAVGLGVPEFGGLAGVYIQTVVDHLAESIFYRIAEASYREGSPNIAVSSFAERVFASLTIALPVKGLLRSARVADTTAGILRTNISQVVRSLAENAVRQMTQNEEARIEQTRQERIESRRAREAEIARRARSTHRSGAKGK